MARKKTVLLMTVGTGVGGDEHKKSLAHGLMSSIEHHNPKKIIFFGSDESRQTISFIEDELNEDYNGFDFIHIEEVDNFKDYFNAIKVKTEEFNDENVIIDYTSGTKTMSVAAAFTSMVCHKKLVSVVGKRDKGTVSSGTETIRTQNIYPVYDELQLVKIKELFNSNRFEAGKLLLNEIVESDDKEVYEGLFDIYYNFDNINYEAAFKLFTIEFQNKVISKFPELKVQLSQNRMALQTIVDKNHKLRCQCILASLLNNAKRRFDEGKYDDAIARLYRSFELVAQIRLKNKYDIITSKVDLESLKKYGLTDDYLNTLDSCRSDLNDDVKIGLIKDYDLLLNLDDDLGIFYAENANEILECSSHRNKSILAHGLSFQTKDDYLKFEQLVLEAANILFNDLDKYLNQTQFPII
ncbi:TIGR02710 family CRISPR-associated CARF protein [Methanobrevibacter millerae]|uniref:CRISPR-associated protein TIGR02710 family n=1 Tax=Methanobrevibacter millerae TaxID=230361 RepID=A0A0U3DSR4_9EURY|nr:TIGR02710 family CRISPR-associated CARF protein [Methanobrevibacter millerae]ALT68970.1 CRISPR-associated protein TIGR02710 family [Methanobrevibacter millerae]